MATYYLLNSIQFGTNALFAGTKFDSAVDNIAGIRAAGGLLVSSSYSTVAAAAAVAQSKRARGADSPELDAIMLAAMEADLIGLAVTGFAAGIQSDTVAEFTPDAGVTADGVKCHNSGVAATAGVVAGAASLNAKAILQADSTTLGFLPPRMTTAQRTAIGTPPEGLSVYDVTVHALYVVGAAGWEKVTSAP